MNDHQCLSLKHKNLFQQGYQNYTPEQLTQIDLGLRFTPAVCSLIAIYGLIVQSPTVLFIVAALGMLAFFFPSGHPMDLFYNKVICKIAKTEPLPANPFQRRLACFAAGIMNTIAGLFFIAEMPVAAYITGGMLMFLQAIVIFTHFCTLSWMYEKLLRFLGMWDKPIDLETAKLYLDDGAILVDVRGPDEFARGHLDCAINIPLEDIDKDINSFEGKQVLVYCASGARSQMARQRLIEKGFVLVFNLGSKQRASGIV